eukprot:15344324-Ditylum_brightwellii.AAC.1
MRAEVVVDDSRRLGDEGFISGCWGTLAEQLDEAYYDDRSDADDDLEKGRIKFPQDKLYGRDTELELLRGLYNDIIQERSSSSAAAQVVFLGGYSGVGKSAMVADLVRQLSEDDKSVVCTWGKYSKLQSAAAPFSATSDALGHLVLELTKDKHAHHLESIREKLCNDETRMAMTSTFPSVAPLFKTFDPANSSDPATVATSMNEVKEAFTDFINCICKCLECPLIWFLDDLQWSDETSLDLLKDVLSNIDLDNMLFIGAYRCNEVNDEHPFHQLMDQIDKARTTNATRIELFGLSPDDIGEFISDTLSKDDPSEVTTLTEVVFKKTLGNIFFVQQALEELVRKNA